MCDCRRLYAHVVVVVLLRCFNFHRCDVVFMFGRFRRVNYIPSETINQINGHQYAVEIESFVF